MTPTDESAKDAIQALREAGASTELVTRLNNDLNQRLLAAARDAAAKGDQAAMQAMLAAARENGVSAAALNAAQRDITAAAQKQQRTNEDIARFAKAAQDRLASGNLLRLRTIPRFRTPSASPARRAPPDDGAGGARRSRPAHQRSACAPARAADPTDANALLDAAESLGGDADLGDLRAALANRAAGGRHGGRRSQATATQDDASAASEISRCPPRVWKAGCASSST